MERKYISLLCSVNFDLEICVYDLSILHCEFVVTRNVVKLSTQQLNFFMN